MHFGLLSLWLLSMVAVLLADSTKKRYDGNVVLSVIPTREEHLELLSKLEDSNEIAVWNELQRNASVHVMFNPTKSPWLTPVFHSLNMQPSTMIADVQKLFDEEERSLKAQARSGTPRGIQDTFQTYDELSAWLQSISATYPNMAQVISIGKTYENRDIWLIKLSAPGGATKKKAFLDFGIHAREWISPATGLYIINELLTKYSSGGDPKTILDTWELHIVPVLNPDGYAYTQRDRMWRKNRKPVGSGCYGVDLNRNYGYKWNTGGSSASPCSDTFHGGAPMSENEAKAMQNYMTGKSWDTYLTFHSYGQWWFTNWGYTGADPPNYAELKQKASIGVNAIRSVNGRSYTLGSSAQLLYIASGGSEDWTRGTLNIFYSYCLELPPTGGNGFIVPTSEIKKTGAETFFGIAAYLKSF